MTLTDRQQQVFDYIVWFLDQNGIPPTVREICEKFAFSGPNAVRCHLRPLVRKGRIAIFPHVARGIKVLVDETCPCCGQPKPSRGTP